MKFILPMIVGGLIGYFTNWLAIKMLFRPYEEKFILGFKIPFTPGLIPKEQKRIAKNIGMTVEEYLLSPEAIIDSFDSNNMELEIKRYIEYKLDDWDKSQLTMEDLLANINDDYKKDICDRFSDKILKEILKDENKKLAKNYLNAILEDDDRLKNIERLIEKFIIEYEEKGKLSNRIDRSIREFIYKTSEDNRLLEELLPKDLEDDIKNYLDENQKLIVYRLRELIESEDINNRLKKSIDNMVESNVSGIITAFVPVESISGKIYEAIEEYIKSDKAVTDINELLKILVRSGFDTKVSNISKSLFSNMDEDRLIENINIMIKNNMDPKNISKSIVNEYKILDKDDLSSNIIDIIFKELESVEFKNRFKMYFNGIITRVNNIKISDILYYVDLDGDKIYSILVFIFNHSIREKLPELIGKLGIAKIVEDTINEFEFDFVEKLILDIADKELKAITNLGGVLGGVIGLLTPLLQML